MLTLWVRVELVLYSHIINMLIYTYTYIYWIHTDAMNKRRVKTSLTNMCTSHFICKGSKRLFKVLLWEGVGDRTETAIFWPHSYDRQPCVFLILQMLNRRPSGPALCWVMAFFTASYQQLLWTPTHQGPKAPRPDVAFPTTSCLSLSDL